MVGMAADAQAVTYSDSKRHGREAGIALQSAGPRSKK